MLDKSSVLGPERDPPSCNNPTVDSRWQSSVLCAEPFSKTLISVANLKIGMLKEFSTSHFYRPIRALTFMLTNLKSQVF